MEQTYDIYEYTYKEKTCNLKKVIYARTDETAEKIIDIANTQSCCCWIPVKRKFKKLVQTTQPPYELEQEQLQMVKLKLERRKKHIKL